MKVIGLDGRTYNWPSKKDCARHGKERKTRSEIQDYAVKLVQSLYPTRLVLEEVKIPGGRLFIDIYVPGEKLAIEVHGIQHFKYSKFFHRSIPKFIEAKKRDKQKEEWCKKNNIRFIILPYHLISQWPKLLGFNYDSNS